jgi:hypothetical protein
MSHLPHEYGVAPPMHEMPKSPKGPWILLLVVALLAVGGVVFGPRLVEAVRETAQPATESAAPSLVPVASSPAVPPPVSSPSSAAKRVVVFEVTGTGTAFNITATVGASVQTESSVRLPWSRTVEVPADELSASVLLVVVAGADGAEVSGKYTIDGTTVREGKASGPYGVLTITDR